MSLPILVVGGAGYIGSHTCKALKQKGYLPIVYDNLINGHRWAAKFGPLVAADLFNTTALNKVFKTYQPKAVLHFASSIDCRASMQDPGGYYQNNVGGSITLLQAMQRNGADLLVFSSSAAVYGFPKEEILLEKHPCNPSNVYGTTKWMAEQIIHDYEKAHGFRSVILRYFNAAGADLNQEIGEAHRIETHLIPLALQTALGRREHLTVFGTNHATADGSAIRDYIHVVDLADAHVKALEWLLAGKDSITLNLGTGQGHSLLEVILAVEKICKRPVKQQVAAKHHAEPSTLVADASLAREHLGWIPAHSDLETIVSTAYEWHNRPLA